MASIKDSARLIKRVVLANYSSEEGLSITPILSGPHGIGKTQIVKKVAKDLNGFFYTVEGGSIKEGELPGLPIASQDKDGVATIKFIPHPVVAAIKRVNSVYYNQLCNTGFLEGKIKKTEKGIEIKVGSTPRTIPNKTEAENAYLGDENIFNFGADFTAEEKFLLVESGEIKPFILLIDELNRSDTQTMKEMMNIILNKSVNGYDFPFFVQIVSAINPASANSEYATNEMDDAQLDRFLKIKVSANLDEWVDYAMGKRLMPEAISALALSEDIFRLKKESNEDKTPMTPSPRGWEMSINLISNCEKTNTKKFFSMEEQEKLSDDVQILVNGKVGEASRTFFKNLRDDENAVKPSEIISGKSREIDKKVLEKLSQQRQIRKKITADSLINYLCENICKLETDAKKDAKGKEKYENSLLQIKEFVLFLDSATRLIFAKKVAQVESVLATDGRSLFQKIGKKCIADELLEEMIALTKNVEEMMK